MSTRLWQGALALAIAVVLPSCVSGSGTQSPHLREKKLVHVGLDSIVPREVALVTVDDRLPLPANSDSMLAHVDLALRSVLSHAAIEVRPGAVNTLTVRVGYPEVAMSRQKPEDCIAVHGVLRLASGSAVSSTGLSCYGVRNIYQMRIANDPNGVYETAVNTMFQGLDKGFDGLALH